MPSFPCGRCTADDIPYMEEITENLHMGARGDLCLWIQSSQAFEARLQPDYSTQQPLNHRLVVPRPPQIPSPHYRRRLKKTSFMFYKARELTGNERVPGWKTNKENEGEKSTAERGIHSSSPRATGLRLRRETETGSCVYYSCRGQAKLSSVNKRRCFFSPAQLCLLINVVIRCHLLGA